MNDERTTSATPTFCHKCGRNLSKATQIIYIDGLPTCIWCIEELNRKILNK